MEWKINRSWTSALLSDTWQSNSSWKNFAGNKAETDVKLFFMFTSSSLARQDIFHGFSFFHSYRIVA